MAILRILHRISTIFLVSIMLYSVLLLSACSLLDTSSQHAELNDKTRLFSTSDAVQPTATDELVELNIVSIGDIILHYPWMDEYNSAGTPLYPEYFQYISTISTDADLALCNVEAPLAGGELSGYPLFNCGDSMAPTVRDAGFDVVYTSHNHMLDQHSAGVLRTLEVLRGADLQTTGSRLSTNEANYALLDVQGVQIAVIAYTYESSPRMINGLPVSEEMDPLINSFTPGSEADLAEMKTLIDESRSAGADLVFFYLHAGTEYSHEVNEGQRSTAQFLADNGVDALFGSHVHVVQTMEMLTPSDGSAPVPVYWGMGNFISSQIEEGGMELANEEGVMADLSISWNPETQQVDGFTMDYLPLWTCYYVSDYLVYSTIPESEEVSTNPSVLAAGKLERAQAAFAEVRAIMGETITWERPDAE